VISTDALFVYFVMLLCLQPLYKTQSVGRQEDVVSAREHGRSTRSQLSAEVPSSAVAHRDKPVATSVSQHRPVSSQSVAETQQIMSDAPIEQRLAHQALPPSGKQRLICSVDVPGIGRAAKVNYIKYAALYEILPVL